MNRKFVKKSYYMDAYEPQFTQRVYMGSDYICARCGYVVIGASENRMPTEDDHCPVCGKGDNYENANERTGD